MVEKTLSLADSQMMYFRQSSWRCCLILPLPQSLYSRYIANQLFNELPTKLVYKPAVICKLNGYYIDGGIFMRLLDVPNEFATLDQYMIAIKEKSQAT